jgi:hypothetical protein
MSIEAMQQLKNAVVHDVLAAFFVYDVLAVNKSKPSRYTTGEQANTPAR